MPTSATTMLPQPMTRRELRKAAQAGNPTATGHALAGAAPRATTSAAGRHRWVSRSAVLGALGILTIAGPLTGTTDFGLSSASAATAAPVALSAPAPGVVDALAAGGLEIEEASSLAADPNARTAAITAASRSHLREAAECPVESVANGTLSAVMGGEEQTTLIMPVAEGSYRITSDYGPRSFPFPGMHEGTDFAGTIGTPLHAVTDGVVTYAGGPRNGRSGQIVVVESEIDGQKVEFWYGHMFTDGVYVNVGDEVQIGEVIGGIGNNGNSTGPHLHFEVHIGGKTVDPLAWLQSNGAEASSTAAACVA